MSVAELAPLTAELRRWRSEGRRARLWLRDDDAVAATPQLSAMTDVLQRFSLRALFAVIPALMDETLTAAMAASSHYVLCQHGLRHQNHEPPAEPKAEFGPARLLADALADIVQGRDAMRRTFGEAFAPVFVPPWNRIADDVRRRLPELGFAGLSAYAEQPAHAVPGLVEVNATLDILNWEQRQGPGVAMLPLPLLASRLADLLRERRGDAPPEKARPVGLLTHHRAMSGAAWQAVSAIVATTLDSDAADWADPIALFGLDQRQTPPLSLPVA